MGTPVSAEQNATPVRLRPISSARIFTAKKSTRSAKVRRECYLQAATNFAMRAFLLDAALRWIMCFLAAVSMDLNTVGSNASASAFFPSFVRSVILRIMVFMCVLKGRRRWRRTSFCLDLLMADLISGIKLGNPTQATLFGQGKIGKRRKKIPASSH